MINARWQLGDAVRVVRNVRNDGTYAGAATGDLLIRRGSVGAVVDIGTFLQDQIIYSVHFLDADCIVGCREEELIDAEEAWIASVYEARERVRARRILSLPGDPGMPGMPGMPTAQRVPRGALGEVLRVVRGGDAPVYHVHFDCLAGRTLAVPEAALMSITES